MIHMLSKQGKPLVLYLQVVKPWDDWVCWICFPVHKVEVAGSCSSSPRADQGRWPGKGSRHGEFPVSYSCGSDGLGDENGSGWRGQDGLGVWPQLFNSQLSRLSSIFSFSSFLSISFSPSFHLCLSCPHLLRWTYFMFSSHHQLSLIF